jgi:hypothetical protein
LGSRQPWVSRSPRSRMTNPKVCISPVRRDSRGWMYAASALWSDSQVANDRLRWQSCQVRRIVIGQLNHFRPRVGTGARSLTITAGPSSRRSAVLRRLAQ